MGKILLIVIIVGVVAYVFSRLTGADSEEAKANGCLASMGCGYSIIQIIIAIVVIVLGIMFVKWLFS